MQEIEITEKIMKGINLFADKLRDVYADDLVSVILYGSAVSAEFVDKHSNLNFLIVLKNTDLEILNKATGLVRKFPLFQALFLTENFIVSSTDTFPIEFLDMRENYAVIYGKDILKDIVIDTKNLRFQCEHELRIKLISLRQLFLRFNKNTSVLKRALFKSFNSVLHIARNILRLKGKGSPYKKELIINALSEAYPLDKIIWQRILSAKNKEIKVAKAELKRLFIKFVKELEIMLELLD